MTSVHGENGVENDREIDSAEPMPLRWLPTPAAFIFSGVLLLLLYGELRVLQLTVEWLNRIPNMSHSRHLDQLYGAGAGLIVILALLMVLLQRNGDSALRQSAVFGTWALGVAFVLGATVFPLCFLGELACYAAAAFLATALLRLPFLAPRDVNMGRLIFRSAAPAAAATLGFGWLALVLAKRIAMEFRVD